MEGSTNLLSPSNVKKRIDDGYKKRQFLPYLNCAGQVSRCAVITECIQDVKLGFGDDNLDSNLHVCSGNDEKLRIWRLN